MWWTNYTGPPSEWTSGDGYSELFKQTVRLIREQFHLVKYRPGEDRNESGQWHNYTLQKEEVRIMVTKFEYDDVARIGSGRTPLFKLQTRMATKHRYGKRRDDDEYSSPPDPPWWLDLLYRWFPDSDWVSRQMRPYQRHRTHQTPTPQSTSIDDWSEFFDHPILIVFPETFPAQPPKFRVDEDRYREVGASHAHHMFDNGWMCILAGDDDWSISRDTVISGLNAAFDWCVWHYKEHGW